MSRHVGGRAGSFEILQRRHAAPFKAISKNYCIDFEPKVALSGRQ
jgi:hypothetical protein